MYSIFSKAQFRWAYSILFVLLMIICSTAKAQRSTGMNADGDILGGSSHSSGGTIMQDGWSVSLNGGYESPLGDLKQFYKGAPTFGVTIRKRMSNLIYSGTIDYRQYKPKQSTFTYSDGDTYSYTATYGKYSGIGLYAGIAYEVSIGGSASIYGGVNGGYVITKYEMIMQEGEDLFLSQSASGSAVYIGPKVGFNFPVSNNVSIGLEGRYSLGIVGANYNTRDGGSVTPGFNSYAGNMFITYSF